MNNLFLKIKKLADIFSYEKMVIISFAGLAIFGVLMLALDAWIFYVYGYKTTNEIITSEYKTSLKKKELADLIKNLDEKETKFNSILKGEIPSLPPTFK